MRTRLVSLALLLALCAVSLGAQTGNDLLQKAAAKMDQDIPGALLIYERIIRDFPSDRPLRAKALMQEAACYKRLGQAKEREVYQRIIKEFEEFPDQADAVKTARIRLQQMKASTWTKDDGLLLAEFKNTTGDPVFDDALSSALAIRLDQSPYLNILSDSRVREALVGMGRPSNERVTHAVAQAICGRAGAKGNLLPSISMGANGQYIVGLDVVACRGELLASVKAEAESREQVRASELKKAAASLRARLGESAQSIKQFDNELALTTSSFEALRAYREGVRAYNAGELAAASSAFSRAENEDPRFASAYLMFSLNLLRASEPAGVRSQARKAYELRELASEKEKLNIAATYAVFVLGDWEKATAALKQLRNLYPRDAEVRVLLGNQYRAKGLFRDGLAELQEAVRLNPISASTRVSLMANYCELDRLGDARALFDDTSGRRLDYLATHARMFELAYLSGDAATIQGQLEWMTNATGLRAGPSRAYAAGIQARASEQSGQMIAARPLSRKLVTGSLVSHGMAAERVVAEAQAETLFGNMSMVRPRLDEALGFDRTFVLAQVTFTHALAGNSGDAATLTEELKRELPSDSIVNAIWIPAATAALEVRAGHGAAAIELLKAATEYEPSANSLWAIYVRGLAYLQMKSGREASAEFQKILDHRGVAPLSPLYPASKMRIAEAYALTGDMAKARAAYQEFFTLWKDADPDVPILLEARAKFAALPD